MKTFRSNSKIENDKRKNAIGHKTDSNTIMNDDERNMKKEKAKEKKEKEVAEKSVQ